MRKHQLFDGSNYHTAVILAYVAGFIYLLVQGLVPNLRWGVLGINFVAMFYILLVSLATLGVVSMMLGERIEFKKYQVDKFCLLVLYALMFAVAEEIIFRGIILTKLQEIFQNNLVAIPLSAAIYALAHILNNATSFLPRGWNWKLVVLTFIAGLYLGYAYLVTGSLIVPVTLHALFIITNQIFIQKKI